MLNLDIGTEFNYKYKKLEKQSGEKSNMDCGRVNPGPVGKEQTMSGADQNLRSESENQKYSGFRTVACSFVTVLLFFFSILLMGPGEIFFGNVDELDFLFGEFFVPLLMICLIATIIVSVIFYFLPENIRGVCETILFSLSLAGYVQVMFLNKGLDILGQNPNGYHPDASKLAFNTIIWCIILAAMALLYIFRRKLCGKIVLGASVFLLAIQLVGFISMPLTAPEKAFVRKSNGYRLSGIDEYTVSSHSNIIVIILDYFSNQYLDEMLAVYPDGADCLHDFTYYSNADCTYFGTFPSLLHMLTGVRVDPDVNLSEWAVEAWNDERTVQFYNAMHTEGNYKVHVYTDSDVIEVGNGCELLRNCIDNVTDDYERLSVDTPGIVRCLTKMSLYRFSPEMLKPFFFVGVSEYSSLVNYHNDHMRHFNPEFYSDLLLRGLTVDDSSNIFSFIHLLGTHEYDTAVDGTEKLDSNRVDTARGCMTIMEEYLRRLKEAGVYDDATIIITADHGGGDKGDMQPIEFIKRAGETHDISPVDTSPISHDDLIATIADAAGLDYSAYGRSIFSITPDEERERSFFLRTYDPDYPDILDRGGNKGTENVYYEYRYTGDGLWLINAVDAGPYRIIPMKQAFF